MARVAARTVVPDGLVYVSEFVSEDEELELLAEIDRVEFEEVRFRGVVARRSVKHYGFGYDFETHAVDAIDPIPGWLLPYRARAAALIEVPEEKLAEALVSRYPPGATIGWHRDAPAFGSRVVGISLASECRMRFRRELKAGVEAYEQRLAPRSAYVLGGAARASWKHSIPPTPALRYSITFRSLRAKRAPA